MRIHGKPTLGAATLAVALLCDLGSPAAHASTESELSRLGATRYAATDQLFITNGSANNPTIRANYVDPVYGAQSLVVEPASVGVMCAISGEQNPNTLVTITYIDPDTGQTITTGRSYISWAANEDDTVEYWVADVAKRTSAVNEIKSRIVAARAGVVKAKASLAKARASGRSGAIANATRRLNKAKIKVAALKKKLAQQKVLLVASKQRLQALREDIQFCRSRRTS